MHLHLLLPLVVLVGAAIQAPAPPQGPPKTVGNPVIPGWYADPEARVFGQRYWIFATYSAPYDQQTFMDCFSSPDLATWTKHPRIIDTTIIKWARRAMWGAVHC